MEAPIITQNPTTVEIEYEGKNYQCKFQIIEESIDVSIYLIDSLKYKGNILLKKIKTQIHTFYSYYIKEVLDEITLLDKQSFSIIKEDGKYKLKINFVILRKENNILIDLVENKDTNLTNNEIINYYENIIKEKDKTISELKEIIKFKDEKIKSLEDRLKNNNKKKEIEIETNNNIKKYDLFNDYNIKLKNPIHKLNIHTSSVICLEVLNDGRLVSCACDNSIIIYNKITYQPDIIIKEHSNSIYCVTKLSSGY